ncbi:MAG: MoaD/ThiS family protein [Archaeoglobi archaeon]|nr:MoaD/ThiS family protein [Candidatus Mnemosynella sp.]MBC7114292.1 MoaD/ThiS family protein [Candidatus Mnemosynella bozhongmuii]
MKIEVSIGKERREVEVNEEDSFEDLLISLNLNPEEYIVLVNGKPVPVEEKIREGEIKILKVVSGG